MIYTCTYDFHRPNWLVTEFQQNTEVLIARIQLVFVNETWVKISM